MSASAIIDALSSLLLLAVVAMSLRARWTRGERRALRELRIINLAGLRYLYTLETWAATRGVALPERPVELTEDYLIQKAEEHKSDDLSEIAQMIGRLRGVQ